MRRLQPPYIQGAQAAAAATCRRTCADNSCMRQGSCSPVQQLTMHPQEPMLMPAAACATRISIGFKLQCCRYTVQAGHKAPHRPGADADAAGQPAVCQAAPSASVNTRQLLPPQRVCVVCLGGHCLLVGPHVAVLFVRDRAISV